MITKKNLPFFFLFLIVTTYKTIFTFITSHLGKNYESTKLVQFFNILNSKTKTGQNSIKYILTYQTHTHTFQIEVILQEPHYLTALQLNACIHSLNYQS